MKKVLILFAVFMLTLTLAACGGECVECETLPEIPATIMLADDNFDDFLGRPEAQYVDLRNFADKMNAGYVSGFEMIPFFDYLEGADVLVRTDLDFVFADEDILNQAQLENLFDKDAEAIFLMCGSGTRAGYVLDALESIGYDNVYNIGGLTSYAGDAKVLGDSTFELNTLAALPDVVDMSNIDMYLGRPDVQYVDLRNFADKMNAGYIAGFEMIPFFEYLEHENILVRADLDFVFAAEDILYQAQLENLFDADKTIFLMCGSGTRAGYVKDALDSLGYENVYNIGGIGSYTGDNKVLGDSTFVLSHPEAGMYTPGTYYGYSDGYVAIVIVGDGGAIVDVFLDAAHFVYGTTELLSMKRAYTLPEEYTMNYTLNDNGTPLDDTDDFYELDAGKLDWWMQADALEAALLANDGWVSTWTLVDGAFGADEVAGVSISVENWMTAVEAAVEAATPVS